MKKDEQLVLGVCWYQSEQWTRLKEISIDRDQLEDTYEEWRKNASSTISELSSNGQTIKKVKINLEELLLWCNEKDIPVNAEARSQYVAYLLQQQSKH